MGGEARYSPLRGYPGGVTHIFRYLTPIDDGPMVGIRDDAAGTRCDAPSLGTLLASPADDIRAAVEDAVQTAPITETGAAATRRRPDGRYGRGRRYLHPVVQGSAPQGERRRRFLPAGLRADRPELFFKSVPWRTVTDAEPIAIRRDSALNVPEAELAIVVNSAAEIVGYTVCDDVVLTRHRGGEPALPAASEDLRRGVRRLAPGIRPAWEVDASDLAITIRIIRGDSVAWEGGTRTSQLHRPLPSLVDCLFAEENFPDGVIISTGTGIVPEMDFTLQAADLVTIEIEQVGSLTNRVVAGKPGLGWLSSGAGGNVTNKFRSKPRRWRQRAPYRSR